MLLLLLTNTHPLLIATKIENTPMSYSDLARVLRSVLFGSVCSTLQFAQLCSCVVERVLSDVIQCSASSQGIFASISLKFSKESSLKHKADHSCHV